MNELTYKPADVPEDCTLKIGPSGFSTFVERPHQWYRDVIMNENPFEYNTSSVLGTVVHYVAEKVAKGEEVEERAIEEYVISYGDKEDYDSTEVLNAWYAMSHALVNEYVIPNKNRYSLIEEEVCAKLADGVYVAGTLDAAQGDKTDTMIVDYKTYNSKTKPKSIPNNYRYQLLTYAWILTQSGCTVRRIRLVYVNRFIDGGVSEKTGKPLKSYPPEVTVLTEEITSEDLEFIGSLLKLCADSVKASEKHPELRHVIWHDPRLSYGA